MADNDPMNILRVITRRFSQIQRRVMACCSPSSEIQCMILTELYHGESPSVHEIADRIGSDDPWVSRMVESLRKDGMLTREPDPDDRRSVKVKLTHKGLLQASRLQETLDGQAEAIMAKVPPDERKVLLASLERLAGVLDNEWQNPLFVLKDSGDE